MKIITFRDSNESDKYRLGVIISESEIVELTEKSLRTDEILSCFDLDQGFLNNSFEINSLPKLNLDEIEICAPIPRPPKIICIGLNYRNHAIESGMEIPKSPIIFSKFTNCAIGTNQPILLPKDSLQVDYEAELAFVIGRRGKDIKAENAMEYVLGYMNLNDVSARDFQFADGQWQRGKACDTFAPMGEFIATKEEIENPHNLRIQFRLNGETLQDSNTEELIFKIPELIEFLSASITLEVGDIIATGTPPGVGFARKPPIFLKDGDVCEVEIEGLGILRNPVKAII